MSNASPSRSSSCRDDNSRAACCSVLHAPLMKPECSCRSLLPCSCACCWFSLLGGGTITCRFFQALSIPGEFSSDTGQSFPTLPPSGDLDNCYPSSFSSYESSRTQGASGDLSCSTLQTPQRNRGKGGFYCSSPTVDPSSSCSGVSLGSSSY